MKLEKKQIAMIGIGALALLLIYWLFFRKNKPTTESSYDLFVDESSAVGNGKVISRPIMTTRPSSPMPIGDNYKNKGDCEAAGCRWSETTDTYEAGGYTYTVTTGACACPNSTKSGNKPK